MTPAIAQACPPTRQHLARRRHLAAAGLGSAAVAAALAAGRLVRVRRGVYSPAPLPARARHLVSSGQPDPAYLAQVRATLLSLGATAMAGGRTAAVLWGLDMFVEPRGVEIVVPASRHDRSPKGITLHRRRGAGSVEHDVLGLEPVRVLSPLMTVVDCARTRPLREAVVIADSAMRKKLVVLDELQRYVEAHAGHPDARCLGRVLDLVDPASGSVLESLCRFLFATNGLCPESQVTMVDSAGRKIGRVDFLFREQRLVIECDGRLWHDPDDARQRDRVRANELERAAWRLLRLTWDEVVHRPEHVLAMVRDCLLPWPVAA